MNLARSLALLVWIVVSGCVAQPRGGPRAVVFGPGAPAPNLVSASSAGELVKGIEYPKGRIFNPRTNLAQPSGMMRLCLVNYAGQPRVFYWIQIEDKSVDILNNRLNGDKSYAIPSHSKRAELSFMDR